MNKLGMMAATLASCLAGTAAHASAQLSNVRGGVLINKGTGYTAVSNSASLKVGDRVMVNPGSSATLSFGDGCSIPVRAGAIVTIGAKSPCSFKAQGTGPGDYAPFIIGGGAALGIAGAIYAGSKDGGGSTFVSVP